MSQTIEQSVTDLSVTVRALRKERGWSQEALAARMRDLGQPSWRQTTVAKVESTSRPRPITLQEAIALAAAFGVPRLTDLLGDESSVSAQLISNFQARNDQRINRAVETLFVTLREMNVDEAKVVEAEEMLRPKVAALQLARDRATADLQANGLRARDLDAHLRDIDPALADEVASATGGPAAERG